MIYQHMPEFTDEVGTVYVIENVVNHKRYVGLTTKHVHVRFEQHIKASRKPKCKYAIQRAIQKYGASNFSISILETCNSISTLRESEKRWIAMLNTHIKNGNGYNMTSGGDGVLGYIFTDDHRNKMRIAHTGKIFSESHKQNIRYSKLGTKNPMYGKHLSSEHKQKIIQKLIGRHVSIQTRHKISMSLMGRKLQTPPGKSVYQVDKQTKQVIHTFVSIHEAARSISPKASASNILYVCKNERNQAYGFLWRFV